MRDDLVGWSERQAALEREIGRLRWITALVVVGLLGLLLLLLRHVEDEGSARRPAAHPPLSPPRRASGAVR